MKVSSGGASRRDWSERRFYEKAWRDDHKQQASEYKKQWYIANRAKVLKRVAARTDSRKLADPEAEKHRAWCAHLKCAYGLTHEAWQQMYDSQGGKCAVSGCALPIRGRGVHVDHNRKTGAVRALLCAAHNKGLGHFHDSPAELRAAADYLERLGFSGAP